MLHKGFAELLVSIFFLALTPLIANATIITIEPDDYGIGSDLSHVSPYVTLKAVSWYLDDRPVTATQSTLGFAPTGDRSFGRSSISFQGGGSVDDFEGFGMFFNQEVSHVSLLGVNVGYPYGAGARWAAFDQAGNRMAYEATAPSSIGETFLMDIWLDGIWSIIIGGDHNMNAIEFDHLAFDIEAAHSSVPEPSLIALVAVGILGSLVTRRRVVR